MGSRREETSLIFSVNVFKAYTMWLVLGLEEDKFTILWYIHSSRKWTIDKFTSEKAHLKEC